MQEVGPTLLHDQLEHCHSILYDLQNTSHIRVSYMYYLLFALSNFFRGIIIQLLDVKVASELSVRLQF